jgi:hypothetical protein
MLYKIASVFMTKEARRRLRFKWFHYQERTQPPRYFLSVVAIVKNEGRFFKEWLDYHIMMGVEKFYIYDNDSTDDTTDVLLPYIDQGIVDYIWWSGEKMQIPAYFDVLKRARVETKWLMKIDLDEFVVPIAEKNIPDFLHTLPKNARQLLIKWFIFGSSGHVQRPDGLVVKNYKYRRHDEPEGIVKSIADPNYVCRPSGAHLSNVIGDTVDENGNKLRKMSRQQKISGDKIRINHYQCKSWEDSCAKRARGDAMFGQNYDGYNKEIFDKLDKNDVRDDIMDQYIPYLETV